jgi:hypothetical protein
LGALECELPTEPSGKKHKSRLSLPAEESKADSNIVCHKLVLEVSGKQPGSIYRSGLSRERWKVRQKGSIQ